MIIHFSGTGNSRHVASLLQQRMKGDTVEIDAKSIASASLTHLTPDADEPVIWVFPVYSWGVPPVVVRYMSAINGSLDRCRHYMVCTCGDDIGLAHEQWRKLVKSRGWQPVTAYSVQMPNTYVTFPGFDVDTKEVEADKLSRCSQRVDSIASRILTGTPGDDVVTGGMKRIKSRLIYPFFTKHMMSPRPFHCLSDMCIGCGLCASACPMDNITMNSGKNPEWGENCAMCLACYHTCPRHAVAYGNLTRKKGQYMLNSRLSEQTGD